MLKRALFVSGAACAVCVACLHTTPFAADPEVTDLTARELEQLGAQAPPTEPFRFVALGDTHHEYDDFARAIDFINATPSELVVIAGDMTNHGLRQEYEWSAGLYRSLSAPFFTVIGNHDWLSDGGELYRRMYGATNYSFVHGGLKFVMFDSNALESPAAPDEDWLLDQVRNPGSARGIVLVTHQNIRRPVTGKLDFYDRLLQEPGVLLAIHGHEGPFHLRRAFGVPVLQCGSFDVTREHTLISIDGLEVSFERCHFGDCEREEAMDEEPSSEAEVMP